MGTGVSGLSRFTMTGSLSTGGSESPGPAGTIPVRRSSRNEIAAAGLCRIKSLMSFYTFPHTTNM